MNKKICLTSLIAMGFVCPAMATPSHTGAFPSGGLMKADYTYTNAATSTNMDGVYEGSVDANAQYENILYQLYPGKYLPENSETPIICNQNGYYCAGNSNGVYYSTSGDQGLTQCPNGYGNSINAASANTDCYRACVTGANGDVPHSSGALTGGVYYDGTSGDGVNACEPTGCINGWHVKQKLGIKNIIGEDSALDSAFVSNNSGNFIEYGSDNQGQLYYGISDKNTWAAYYGADKGALIGQARCSKQSGTNYYYVDSWSAITTVDSLVDETGQDGAAYCWCRVTGYKKPDGTVENVTSKWVFIQDYSPYGGASQCADTNGWNMGGCAIDCALGAAVGDPVYHSNRTLIYREALLNTINDLATCEANTITINWNGTTPEAISANNAGTATYGGDVRTPQSATPVPGKRFTGWRFSAPTPVSVDPQGE